MYRLEAVRPHIHAVQTHRNARHFPPLNTARLSQIRGPLVHVLSTSDLRSLNCTHLGDPSSRRLNLADGTNLVAGVAWNANVVAALEGELDVANLEDLGAAFFGVLAGCLEDLIDEGIGNIEDRL